MRTALTAVFLVALAGCQPAKAPAPTLRVTSPAIPADGRIDPRQSAHGANLSPPLRWTPVAGAKTYAITMDDPDAPGTRPFVHWLMWSIPAGVTALAEGASGSFSGAVQGENDNGQRGYFGPAPPSGIHHYRLRVFALDGALTLAPGAGGEALARAMAGHVIAQGELDGTFAAPSN